MSLSAPTSVVSIGSVGLDAGQLELHGTVNGQPVDTFPPDPSAFLALPDVASQQAYVACALAAAAINYPRATSLALQTATPLIVSGGTVLPVPSLSILPTQALVASAVAAGAR